jgi:histidinol dehydrogenase
MNIITYKDFDFKTKINELVVRNSIADSKIINDVEKVVESVKNDGDEAVINICNKFDGSNFNSSDDLLVTKKEIDNAFNNVDLKLLKTLQLAYERIFLYHSKQLPSDFEYKDDIGVVLGNKWKAIESICVYVPGGTAIYPSSVLMSAIPAIVAGVSNIVVSVPSCKGVVDDSVLVACKICGISKIYKIGGPAAIAAFAYGTNSITKVNKIVGPGNSYVALAKKQLFGVVGIDMIAGPTDILIICDNNVQSSWVAVDLLSQLEHGVDSRAIVITDDLEFAKLILRDTLRLVLDLSRKDIIERSLVNSCIVVVENLLTDSVKISNNVAPEHLEIMVNNPDDYVDKIVNAGAIFLGNYTPEVIGDYIAGPSHTLPTMSSAKFSSGLSVFDFLKRISIISCDKSSFMELQESVAILADVEGFDAHKLSSQIRK